MALGGDTVGIAAGRLVVNGRPTRELFVDHGMVDGRYFGPLRVPPGSVFLLGDNRANSRDSREFGAIREDQVTAEVFVRLWPPDLAGSRP